MSDVAPALQSGAAMEPNALEMEGLSIETPDARIVRGLDWTIRDHATTVLLGPAGSGKSTLLRAMAGRSSPGVKTSGRLRCFGEPVSDTATSYYPQPAREAGERLALGRLAEDPARVLLLDEPDRATSRDDREALVSILRAHTRRGAVVVVTHDLELARAVADDVALLCAGGLVAQGPSPAFFESPPNELSARFVRQGNCWPAASPPELPAHFRWILEGQLAGMGRPGLLRDADDDLASIALAGITLLVSLVHDPLPAARLRGFGIQLQHFPIEDMKVPPFGRTADLVRTIARAIERGERVAVHCHAGLGRTGTILASYLVWQGASAHDALQTVRAVRPEYVQNSDQERFVRGFEMMLRP